MALDPEEFRKRREQRAQEREKQKARQKKTLLILGAILVALGVTGCMIVAVVMGMAEKPAETPAPETTATEATEAVRNPEEITTIHIAAAGDLNVTERVVHAGGEELDYTDAFLDVAHLLGEADVTVLNFEGVLCGAPYGTDRSAPQTLVDALSRAGVDLLQLANSYSIHKGVSGLGTTIDSVRSAGMTPLGAYATRSAARAGKGYVICEVKGVRIAFVAFTKGMDGMALPAGSENCVNLLYEDYSSAYQTVDTEGITKVLERVEEAKPDLTVALLHWGSEYNDNISKTQESIRDLFLANGVDAIIGTHSHFVQKMELNPETGTFVAYSLGDFMGDTQRAGSEYSVILDLEITKNIRTGKTKIAGYSYTPIFTVNEKDRPVQVVQIEAAMKAHESGYIDAVNKDTYNDMAYALKRIEARTAGE